MGRIGKTKLFEHYFLSAVSFTRENRFAVSFSLANGSLNYVLPTFAAAVFCLEASPIDPNLLAIGAGDNLIRVWKEKLGQAGGKGAFDVAHIFHKRLQGAKVCRNR